MGLKKFIRWLFPAATLRSRIYRNLMVFTAIPFILVALYVLYYTNRTITSDYTSNMSLKLNECVQAINETLNMQINKSSNIVQNQYLLKNIGTNFSDDLEQVMVFMDIIKAMIGESYSVNGKRPYVIYTYNETLYEGVFVDSIGRMKGNALVEKAMKAPGTEIIWDPNPTIKNSEKYLTFYRNIANYNTSVGILEVNIPYAAIEEKLSTLGRPENGIVFFKNVNGDVLYFKNYQGMEIDGPEAVTARDFILLSSSLMNGDTITAAVSIGGIYKKNIKTFLLFLLGFLVYVFVLIFASRHTAKRITGSLENFINGIRQDENLLLNEKQIQITGNDEVAFIKQKFKDVISRMNEYYKELINIKHENSSLEIELLQSRINPHLLYNSLSVIKWNALWNKDIKTVDMIDTMTKYYRIALNKGNNIISIAAELDMIKEYVKINVFAHSAQYILEIDAEEEVLSYYTLKHLLQPIVENSILHGLNGKAEDARILIKAYRQGGDILFEVMDNGRGMEENDIEKIMSFNYKASYGGYGIKNLIKRIQANYGDDYGIKITGRIGEGTAVSVRIKAYKENELADKIQAP